MPSSSTSFLPMKVGSMGVSVATGSTAALKPRPGGQCYAASKGAVTTMTQSLALELAPFGIRVVVIAPVATETPMLPTFMGKKEVDEEGMQRYVATVPLGRLNQPEDIAKAALFLASDDAGLYAGRTVWAKDPRRMINPRQAERADTLWKSIAGVARLDSAEGRSWESAVTRLSASPPLAHGLEGTGLGYVTALTVA